MPPAARAAGSGMAVRAGLGGWLRWMRPLPSQEKPSRPGPRGAPGRWDESGWTTGLADCARVCARLGFVTGDPSRYDDGQNTRWDLVAYSTHDDRLVGSFPITREQFIRVRELFDYGDDHWFANSYLVRLELWPRVIEMLSCPPPKPDREHFIEGTATDY